MTIYGLRDYVAQIDAHASKLHEMTSRPDVTPAELTAVLLETTMFLAHLALHLYERDERTSRALRGYV